MDLKENRGNLITKRESSDLKLMRPRGENVTCRFLLKAISVFIPKELDNVGDFVLVKSRKVLAFAD